MLTSNDLRSRYLAFFAERGHATIPSASLVPTNDPTVLFTTAGMHPLVPYLLGEPHPAGARLANVQRCVRTGDIDVVGDDTHLTFFEMLGNWSLADYGREDAIRWSFEFLTSELELPLERFGVTCYTGDDKSMRLWHELGVPSERVQFLPDNWWGPAGTSGPCGPDTEMFVWTGEPPPPRTLDVADPRWVEIWNDVFMSYTVLPSGETVPLPRANVDTGMGLERTLVALTGARSVYDVDTMRPLIEALRTLAMGRNDRERELRVIADHVRAACMLIADGVEPSNKDRGYVVRRLLRRALVFGKQLGLPRDWYALASEQVATIFDGVYPFDHAPVTRTIATEADKFEDALAHGLRVLERHRVVDGKLAFDLFQTHGFPFELVQELAQRAGTSVDEAGFRWELERHREKSRGTMSAPGGLAEHSAETARYHTLTHLLHAALRTTLGDHVVQRGSNITRDRLRFDYSHGGKPTPDELERVEALVNDWIARDLVVERATMTEPEARAIGAIGAFGEKYGAIVSVYSVVERAGGATLSREICGGPHVATSLELSGRFRIVKEQGIATGIRRIKAVLEPAVA